MLDSFTQFADSQTQPIKESYKTGKYEIRQFLDPPKGNECGLPCGYFYKIQYINLQASYDVKKTYSLLNPYVGTILMSNDKLFYYSSDNTFGKYATETEAEEANLARRKDGAKMKFLYVYRAVSYTHLDVYKRQPPWGNRPASVALTQNANMALRFKHKPLRCSRFLPNW